MLVSELVFRILMDIAPGPHPGQFRLDADLAVLRQRLSPQSGEAWALHQHAFGGMGGRPGADGLGAVSFPYNVRNVSVEWSESETPVLFERRELIPNSGGAGRVARRSRRGARLPHRAVRRHRPAAGRSCCRAPPAACALRRRARSAAERARWLDRGQRPAHRADQRPRSEFPPGRPGAA